MRGRCLWVEQVEPEIIDWSGGVLGSHYRRLDTGEELRGELQPGALIVIADNAYGSYSKGCDGLAVACILPTGRWWYIDGRATNCTMPDDTEHRSWGRHGTKGGTLHVDKNGLTCQAGAGSIAAPHFNGFLHNGELYDC